jgi:hypothetical protein
MNQDWKRTKDGALINKDGHRIYNSVATHVAFLKGENKPCVWANSSKECKEALDTHLKNKHMP